MKRKLVSISYLNIISYKEIYRQRSPRGGSSDLSALTDDNISAWCIEPGFPSAAGESITTKLPKPLASLLSNFNQFLKLGK